MITTFEVKDPRVFEIIKEATKAAQPLWVGYISCGIEVLPRMPVYFEPADCVDCYFNVEQIISEPVDSAMIIDHGNISKTKNGDPIFEGPYIRACRVGPGDLIAFGPGALVITGPITREFWT
jgi:hypothetical protein